MNIDLHVHTTASDGTLSPREVVALARRIGLGALAITDHDTLLGAKQAKANGIPTDLRFLTGVEISADRPHFLPGAGSLHILGYAIDLDNPRLNRTLDRLQEARRTRNPRILKRLNHLGVDIRMADIQAQVQPGGQIGRPHFATAMVKKGYAQNINDAFDRYLGTEKPAYVEKDRIGCKEAIALIRHAGGVAVLAHPGLITPPTGRLEPESVAALQNMGMGGIEAYYPEHSPEQTAHYEALAGRFGLLVTGGTDFHGALKPQIQLGSGLGDLRVPMDIYHRIVSAAANTGKAPSPGGHGSNAP